MAHEDSLSQLSQLVEAYRGARITRREALKRAAALGVGASALAALLAGARPAGAAAVPAAQDQPKSGGTLREGYDLDFSRMDPVTTNWYDPAFSALYENLITNDPEGKKVPQLAESWQVAPDGKSVTFKLRSGLKFHSGAPLNAAAVKALYDEIKANGILKFLFDPVSSVEARDETTLTITMSHPYYDIINVVDTGYWAIANQATRQKLGADYGAKQIDGSGPFTFGEWVPGSHVTVNRWNDYPGSIVPYFQNKGKAYLDSIRWETILEAAQRAVRIENGEIDTLRGPAAQDVARLQGNPDLNVIKLKEWSGYIMGLGFTHTELDFDKLEMRQAISQAINRPAIAKATLFGEGEPLYGPVTTADRYYTKDVEQYNQFNLDAAKKLVDGLGWKAGSDGILTKNGKRLEFTLPVQDESFNKQLGAIIQDQLKQLGASVKVQALDRGTFFSTLQDAKNPPQAYLFYYLWPVPIDIVTLFVGSATKGNPNWAQASVPEVDAAIKAWQNAATADDLAKAGAQFQVAVAKYLPTIPLINRNSVWVARKNVHGYLVHQWNLYPFYNDVWLS